MEELKAHYTLEPTNLLIQETKGDVHPLAEF
jgi:hypothetical protein